MKCLVTILLLAILVFNWVGYRLFIAYKADKAGRELASRLNNDDYEESQLVSFKVPVRHLSYYNISGSFHRVDGRIEIDGLEYRYVKSRLFDDSLEVLCVPDRTAAHWRQAKDDFFKRTTGLSGDKQNSTTSPGKPLPKTPFADDYTLHDFFTLTHPGSKILNRLFFYSEKLPSCFANGILRPPEPTPVAAFLHPTCPINS